MRLCGLAIAWGVICTEGLCFFTPYATTCLLFLLLVTTVYSDLLSSSLFLSIVFTPLSLCVSRTHRAYPVTLRATFGKRITRKEAVREWERLRHTTSIDDFVDEITRLMWVTGFEGQQVEDKIERGLNDVMHLE